LTHEQLSVTDATQLKQQHKLSKIGINYWTSDVRHGNWKPN